MSLCLSCDTGKGNEVLANIEAANQRREALKQRFPELAELYEIFIEPKFEKPPLDIATVSSWRPHRLFSGLFAHHRVAVARIVLRDAPSLVQRHGGTTSVRGSKDARIGSGTYRDSLSEIERSIYDAMLGVERDAFRILRDLALRPEPKHGRVRVFHVVQATWRPAADRSANSAYRMLRRFNYNYGLIECVTKGKQWVLVKSRKRVSFAGC